MLHNSHKRARICDARVLACSLPKLSADEGGLQMKKLIATAICLVAISSAAIPVDAQTRRRRVDTAYSTQYRDYANRDNRYRNYRYRDRSFWDKHRDS
jgi:hypothetical protein